MFPPKRGPKPLAACGKPAPVERDKLLVAAEEDAERLARAEQGLRARVQLFHPAPRQLVDPPVEPARIVASEPERAETFEQLVTVRRLLAEQEQEARTQEVLGQRRLRHALAAVPPGSAPPLPA